MQGKAAYEQFPIDSHPSGRLPFSSLQPKNEGKTVRVGKAAGRGDGWGGAGEGGGGMWGGGRRKGFMVSISGLVS